MLKGLLGLDETQQVTGLSCRGGWPLALLLIAVAAAFAIYLYRSETRLPSRRRAILSACQFLALLAVIIIVLEPVARVTERKDYKRNMIVLLDTSRSMATADRRTSPEEVGEAARVLGKLEADAELPAGDVEAIRQQIGSPSRLALATAALGEGSASMLDELGQNFDLRFFTFDGSLNQSEDEGTELRAEGDVSRVGVAIEEAVGRFAGQPVAGVVVLSDFISVEGEDPVEVARRFGDPITDIPIYTVPVGLERPPDIHVRKILAPEVVFQGDRVPIKVQIDSDGYAGRSVEVALRIDGQEEPAKPVELEDGVVFAEQMFIPEQESGTIELEFAIPPVAGEITDANNSASHKVRILDEKIKVLYVEGSPRWEFRYLRWVLLRDQRLDVRFLMTQGDPALAAASPLHIGRFPQTKEDLFKYDLIILGDVPAGYFKTDQLELIEELVGERGGSLLMVAGPVAAPTSYRDTPIADMLPIKIGPGSWSPVNANVHPVVTADGRESQLASLAISDEVTDRIWSNVRPMHYLPPIEGAKRGAEVLLTLSNSSAGFDQYPLVAWQRYRTGKSMFVATEDLWRMRLEEGDRYHARFWGQSIQFLTLSRLLGENKQITLETNNSTYSAGDPVQIFANVLTESFEPVEAPEFTVVLERKGAPDSAAEIVLAPMPGSPGMFSGSHVAGEDGTYVLKAQTADESRANSPEFEVATVPREDRETGARPDVARQIAELSGGRTLTLSGLSGLPGELGSEAPLSSVAHYDHELWDIPLWFMLLLVFAGIEWFLRRRENLV